VTGVLARRTAGKTPAAPCFYQSQIDKYISHAPEVTVPEGLTAFTNISPGLHHLAIWNL